MSKKKISLQILTPDKIKIDKKVDRVILRCVTGDMGILPGREAVSAVLDDGILRVLNDGGEQRIAVFGGLAEVQNDTITLLTDSAEWPEDIDRSRAEAEREEALWHLREMRDSLHRQNYRVLLRRALLRLEVSSSQNAGMPEEQGTPV